MVRVEPTLLAAAGKVLLQNLPAAGLGPILQPEVQVTANTFQTKSYLDSSEGLLVVRMAINHPGLHLGQARIILCCVWQLYSTIIIIDQQILLSDL